VLFLTATYNVQYFVTNVSCCDDEMTALWCNGNKLC